MTIERSRRISKIDAVVYTNLFTSRVKDLAAGDPTQISAIIPSLKSLQLDERSNLFGRLFSGIAGDREP